VSTLGLTKYFLFDQPPMTTRDENNDTPTNNIALPFATEDTPTAAETVTCTYGVKAAVDNVATDEFAAAKDSVFPVSIGKDKNVTTKSATSRVPTKMPMEATFAKDNDLRLMTKTM